MDVLTAAKRRRSTRRFETRRRPRPKILRVLEAARLPPSGGNRQPLTIVVVDDQKLKAEIRGECERADRSWWERAPSWFRRWAKEEGISLDKEFLTSAPYLLCIFGDSGAPYWFESAWIAIGYATLEAEEQDLGCLTYTPGSARFLNRLLAVPPRLKPVAVVPVGYRSEKPRHSEARRKQLTEICFLNQYGRFLSLR